MFVPLSAIAVLSFFLLPLLASMAGAYPIAGEAEQGTMKTWLSRPVSRATVLFSKWGIAIVYVIIGMLLVWGGGLLAGGIVFGLKPLVTLSGTTVEHPPRRVADVPDLRPDPARHDVRRSRWPRSSRRSPTRASRRPSSPW